MLPNRSRLSVLVFLLPPLLLYGVAVLFPIMQSLFLSFFSWNGISDMEFVGLANYVRMLTGDDIFWRSFCNALGYLAICLVLQLGGALLVASLLTSHAPRPRADQDSLPPAGSDLHRRDRVPLRSASTRSNRPAFSTSSCTGSASASLNAPGCRTSTPSSPPYRPPRAGASPASTCSSSTRRCCRTAGT